MISQEEVEDEYKIERRRRFLENIEKWELKKRHHKAESKVYGNKFKWGAKMSFRASSKLDLQNIDEKLLETSENKKVTENLRKKDKSKKIHVPIKEEELAKATVDMLKLPDKKSKQQKPRQSTFSQKSVELSKKASELPKITSNLSKKSSEVLKQSLESYKKSSLLSKKSSALSKNLSEHSGKQSDVISQRSSKFVAKIEMTPKSSEASISTAQEEYKFGKVLTLQDEQDKDSTYSLGFGSINIDDVTKELILIKQPKIPLTISTSTPENTSFISYFSTDDVQTPRVSDFNARALQLPSQQAKLYACILEEVVEGLSILGAIERIPNLKTRIGYKTLDERIADGKLIDEKSEVEARIFLEAMTDEIKSRYKFQQERLYAQIIMKETIRGLRKNKSYYNLTKRILEYQRSQEDDTNLFYEVEYNNLVIPKLKTLLERELVTFETEIQGRNERIGNLKDTIEDETYLSKIKKRYVDRWENSRYEQNRIRLNIIERDLNHTIKEYNDKIVKEERVHDELVKFNILTTEASCLTIQDLHLFTVLF